MNIFASSALSRDEPFNQMTVYKLDPLTDPRWPEFVANHPKSSIFHTREWLDVLRRSYGYEPVAFSTSQEKLSNAVVFCQIQSWLTGRRLVSLPFSDHCQPLANGHDLEVILNDLNRRRRLSRLRYIELRPHSDTDIVGLQTNFVSSETFCFQKIDLRPDLPVIYKGFHDSCIRRKIKKAEREELFYESGRSEELLQKFCHLLLLTRRRHKLPPQPASWFSNIVKSLGEMMTIHLLSKGGTPVSCIMTLKYKKSLIYKYGCSDAQFNNLGGTPLIFWKVIQQAKSEGIEEFDLGRSGYEDPGLIAFKEHLGAMSTELRYYRSPVSKKQRESSKSAGPSFARQALARMPDSVLTGVGQLFYRHLG
jgi:lipid II:glycine glycyltransferase (peptidoglycan interpeptide bridge formation enzyme)